MAKNAKAKAKVAKANNVSKQKTAVELKRPLNADEALKLQASPKANVSIAPDNNGAIDPRAPMSKKELQALRHSAKVADILKQTRVPEAEIMSELDIVIDKNSNRAVPVMTTLSHMSLLAARAYNACINIALYEEYRPVLLSIGMESEKVAKFYADSPEGQEIAKAYMEAKANNDGHTVAKLNDRKKYIIEQLGYAAMLVTKQVEAEANGFEFWLSKDSKAVRIWHMSDIRQQPTYTVDNVAKISFAGKRSVAELEGKKKVRKARKKAGSQAAATGNQGIPNAEAKAPPVNVPVGFAAVPNTLGLLATAIAKSDEAAKAAMPIDEKNKVAVNLVEMVQLFRAEDIKKSPELRGYVSDVVVTLLGLLNISTMAEAKKIATRDNDAPKAIAKK